jgi:hypothetical protein
LSALKEPWPVIFGIQRKFMRGVAFDPRSGCRKNNVVVIVGE